MDLKEVLKILIEKLQAQSIDFVLIGGLALSTMNIFRFTKDLDFMVHETSKDKIHAIMTELGYAKQDFSSDEIISYLSPLNKFGQVDFLLARRKYSQAMMLRAQNKPVFNGSLQVKALRPEDIIGLKIQAIVMSLTPLTSSSFFRFMAGIWTWTLSGNISGFLKRKTYWMNGSITLI